ncbi:MAG: CCA tRNA nucleotidyltransferase [Tissierellia bacterium]|nr:CCA tRNA nucleotidyltransferase [Tissierellia bacterium]
MDKIWPVDIIDIAETLENAGYEAWLVGGAIRDLLLGQEPNDWDLATDATPEKMKEVFSEFATTWQGSRYGTVGVRGAKTSVEITTFRSDSDYSDGRHPDTVIYSNSIEEDLKRRDFTINAIAWNPTYGLLDPMGGAEDIKNRIIRTVGKADERFNEDCLRMIRAVRFAGQLNFSIEDKTISNISKNAKLITGVAKERIGVEFSKILIQPNPKASLNLLKDTRLLEFILPEANNMVEYEQKSPYHSWTLWEHTLKTVIGVSPELHLRLAAFFHDIGKPATQEIDEKGIAHYHGHEKISAEIAESYIIKFGLGKELSEKVCRLIKRHMLSHANLATKGYGKIIREIGEDEIPKLVELWKADRLATLDSRPIDDIIEKENKLSELLELDRVYKKEQLAIDGHDLLHIGYKQGKIIGEILNCLTEEVMENPSLNDREKLLALAKLTYTIEMGDDVYG